MKKYQSVIKKDSETIAVSAEIDSQSQFLPSSISVCIFSLQNKGKKRENNKNKFWQFSS